MIGFFFEISMIDQIYVCKQVCRFFFFFVGDIKKIVVKLKLESKIVIKNEGIFFFIFFVIMLEIFLF